VTGVSIHPPESLIRPLALGPRRSTSSADRAWPAQPATNRSAAITREGLPLPSLRVADMRGATFYAMSAIDRWGRLSDRSALHKLGWTPGTPLAITTKSRIIVVVADREGSHRVTSQSHLRLPATVRHAAHIEPADRLLIAARRDQDALVVYPMPAVDAMVAAFHSLTSAE
jgi:hypothetical protein